VGTSHSSRFQTTPSYTVFGERVGQENHVLSGRRDCQTASSRQPPRLFSAPYFTTVTISSS
jgi:hypothetical protein